MKPKYLNPDDPWMLGEDIPDCDLFFSQIWLSVFANGFIKNTGKAYTRILTKYEGYHLWFYFGERVSFEVAENIKNKIVNEKKYARVINKNIIKQADILRKFSAKIPINNLDKLSNKELWEIYKKHDILHKEYYTWCWIPVAVDMFHNNLTSRLKKYLKEIGIKQEKINEYFIILTQPTSKSLIFKEQQELLNIGKKIEKDNNLFKLFKEEQTKNIEKEIPRKILNLLEKHRKKYYYTKHIFVNGEYIREDYIKQLKDILSGDKLPSEIIRKQNFDLKNNKKRKKKLFKNLRVDKKWRGIFTEFGEFMVTKIYRRYAQIFALYQMGFVLQEIARRFNLSEKQIRFMLPREVKEMLLKDSVIDNGEEILSRSKFCVYYVENGFDKVYIGKEAEEILTQIKININKDIKELCGEIGCPGLAKGKVKIIIRAEDMKKMEEGDILVSIATDPDIVPAMKKAGAIVTEQGGVTSHAVIVSRELGIPCVIGTKIATKVFKDGDMVEVDANNGIVKKIN